MQGSVFAHRLIWWLRSIPRNLPQLTKAGLSPDGSSTYFLPRELGIEEQGAHAGNQVVGAQNESWGLVNQVVPEDQLAKPSRHSSQ